MAKVSAWPARAPGVSQCISPIRLYAVTPVASRAVAKAYEETLGVSIVALRVSMVTLCHPHSFDFGTALITPWCLACTDTRQTCQRAPSRLLEHSAMLIACFDERLIALHTRQPRTSRARWDLKCEG